MKQNFTFLFFLFAMTVFGQKTVNDSIEKKEFEEYDSLILKKTQLPNLLKTKQEFYFRLSYDGTKIDIWRDSLNNINGILTKYVYSRESKTNKRDTIIKKYPIHNSKEIHKLINESKILEIPLEKEIKNWENGRHGNTYTLEFADKDNYQIKSYWSPRAQDSTIIEAQKLVLFCDKINFLSKNDSLYQEFKDDLKPRLSYTINGYQSFYKIENSNIYLYYNGNYRLPLGIYFGYYVNKIKKKKFNMGIRFQIQNNLDNNLNFENVIWKRKIFGNQKTYFDSFRLIYEYNKLDYIKTFPKFENYKINYNGTIDKYFSFGVAYNQLKTQKTFNGISLGFSKRFESINLEPYYTIDIFENSITNYKIGLDKSFQIKTENKIFQIYTSLFYEKTFDFKSLNLSLVIPIKDWIIN
ncbi:MAG: hypothetical protein A3G95_05690 [Flavobacteria bacterium RIFCSPLOWO2_12_FULL_31_7]|nr:MAG: hypothetical protein A3G95_05690 [Flavobacteria bacterium RIFCSPLOWO2_12_FULL_31_7]